MLGVLLMPPLLGDLVNLEQLNVAHYMLSRTISKSICQLPKLQNFTYPYNFFTGELPVYLGLPEFHDERNCLPKIPVQLSPGQYKAFLSKKIHCSAFRCHKFVPILPSPSPLPPVYSPPPPTPSSPPPPPPPSPPPPPPVYSPPPPPPSPPPHVYSPPPPPPPPSPPPPSPLPYCVRSPPPHLQAFDHSLAGLLFSSFTFFLSSNETHKSNSFLCFSFLFFLLVLNSTKPQFICLRPLLLDLTNLIAS
uniref:Leucine-rich repeat extensin 3 n=1 Tax=Solanum tuberosum TaxID=4113 RepID=M1BB36_SOLTU